MFRNVTFTADDLDCIESIVADDSHKSKALIEMLKETVSDLVAEETICLELYDDMVELTPIAEGEFTDLDTGILNHIAIQFYHDGQHLMPSI